MWSLGRKHTKGGFEIRKGVVKVKNNKGEQNENNPYYTHKKMAK